MEIRNSPLLDMNMLFKMKRPAVRIILSITIAVYILGYLIKGAFAFSFFNITAMSFAIMCSLLFLKSLAFCHQPTSSTSVAVFFLFGFIAFYFFSTVVNRSDFTYFIKISLTFLVPFILLTKISVIDYRIIDYLYRLCFLFSIMIVIYFTFHEFFSDQKIFRFISNRVFVRDMNPIGLSWQLALCVYAVHYLMLNVYVAQVFKRMKILRLLFLSIFLCVLMLAIFLSGSRGAIFSFVLSYLFFSFCLWFKGKCWYKYVFSAVLIFLISFALSFKISDGQFYDRLVAFTKYDVLASVSTKAEFDDMKKKWIRVQNDTVAEQRPSAKQSDSPQLKRTLKKIKPSFIENYFNHNIGSVQKRLFVFRHVISQFMQSPWLGVGSGGLSIGEFDYPHNIFLEVLGEIGVFGFLFFVLFLFLLFRSIGTKMLQAFHSLNAKDLLVRLPMCAMVIFLFLARQTSGSLLMSKDFMLLASLLICDWKIPSKV